MEDLNLLSGCVFCYFSRIDGVVLPGANAVRKFSALPCTTQLMNYINCSNPLSIQPTSFVLFTQDIVTVAEKIKSSTRVTLRGPKGCGKSFIATVLFIYLQEKKACLYLCPKSFHNPFTKSYLLAFLDRHKTLIEDKDYERLHKSFASYKEECPGNIVVELISCFVERNELYLFVDFSDIVSYVARPAALDNLMNCVDIFSPKGHLTTTTSYSSGISIVKKI